MYSIFNMGHRMEIYTDPSTAASIIELANSFNIASQVIGHVAPSNRKQLSIHGPEGVIEFQ
jgi:phosphoribosylformylglycinamidine cyclo-ligase